MFELWDVNWESRNITKPVCAALSTKYSIIQFNQEFLGLLLTWSRRRKWSPKSVNLPSAIPWSMEEMKLGQLFFHLYFAAIEAPSAQCLLIEKSLWSLWSNLLVASSLLTWQPWAGLNTISFLLSRWPHITADKHGIRHLLKGQL